MISLPVPFGKSGVLYIVESVSTPGETYTVQVGLDGKAASCDCKGWKYHGKCKHAQMAEDALPKDMARWALLSDKDFLNIEEVIEAFAAPTVPAV